MNTTILILISRPHFLDLVFAGLEMLECDPETTNLLGIVDGDQHLYLTAHTKITNAKFNQKLCVQYKTSDKMKNYDMAHRRRRIANIHNFAKNYIKDTKYIFGIEDDTTFAPNALVKLQHDMNMNPFAGLIQGYQIGRWGIPYYGVWQADDIYEPKRMESMPKGDGIQTCDAGGFYCFITRAENYMAVDHQPFENNGLGPDVNYGMELRRQGYMNYTDWNIGCNHHTKDGIIRPSAETEQVTFVKVDNRWRQQHDEVVIKQD